MYIRSQKFEKHCFDPMDTVNLVNDPLSPFALATRKLKAISVALSNK